MKVIIDNQTRDIPVTSVYLTTDLNDPNQDKLKMFFCFNCRTSVTQYRGGVIIIVPGEPVVKIGTIVRCPNARCLARYCFRAIE